MSRCCVWDLTVFCLLLIMLCLVTVLCAVDNVNVCSVCCYKLLTVLSLGRTVRQLFYLQFGDLSLDPVQKGYA